MLSVKLQIRNCDTEQRAARGDNAAERRQYGVQSASRSALLERRLLARPDVRAVAEERREAGRLLPLRRAPGVANIAHAAHYDPTT
jgi:hypothetical protein